MNASKFTQKLILSLGLIFLFSSSSARHISEWSYLTDPLFRLGGLLIIIAALSSLIKNETTITNTLKVYTYLYGAFISFIIISIIANQNLQTEITSLERFVLAFIFLSFFLTLASVVSKGLIITSFMISSTLIFTYFLIEYPISNVETIAYQGGFGNPNSVGVLAVTLFSVSLVATTSLIKERKNYLLAILSLLIGVMAGYLTIISASRTSFITLVIIFALISISFIYDVLKTRNLLSFKSVIITIGLIIGGTSIFLIFDNPLYAAIESSVLDKFNRKVDSGSMTSGRMPIWTEIINHAGLFGKGTGYFKEISGLGAHNSFLHIVSLYGWVAAVFYMIFWLAMLIKSVHYYLTEKLANTYALLPLILVINFISLSMMENMSMHVSAFIALSMVAIFSQAKSEFTIGNF